MQTDVQPSVYCTRCKKEEMKWCGEPFAGVERDEHNIAGVTCGMDKFLTSLNTKENMLHFMKDSFIRTF